MSPKNDDEYDQSSLPSLLPIYYKYLFPYSPYYQWLSYQENAGDISKREFSFTLANDIYIRYKSFGNQEELEKELQNTNPYKIDIGAIYNLPPKDHKRHAAGKFKPQTKELVFDIDMTDYDEIRNCCQGADICSRCWTLMKIAIKILDETLRDDFGFKNILWIYSGRRGVHCWVCDASARQLSSHGRVAIVEYLTVLKAGRQEKKVKLRYPIHPYVKRCIRIVKSYWEKYGLQDQDLLLNDKTMKYMMKLLPDTKFRETVTTIMKNLNLKTSTERWIEIVKSFKEYCNEDTNSSRHQYLINEIILELCLPRLDANVSKGVNHLLKSPFSVHPKTGRVCVPIDPENVDEFDPFTVPTISDLCVEIEHLKKEDDDEAGNKKAVYMSTSLGKYMKTFDEFLAKLKVDEKKIAIRTANQKASPYEF